MPVRLSIPSPPTPLRRILLGLAFAGALLAGCALTSSDAHRCSGPRRPANPHGSVLAPQAPAAPTAAGGQCAGAPR
jgi:hypothetical protein